MKRKELVEKINQILGTKLEFRRVALRELEKLHDAISAKAGGAPILPIGRGLLDAPIAEVLKKRLSQKRIEEMTVRDFLSILQEGSRGKGILGFGVLPALLRGRR